MSVRRTITKKQYETATAVLRLYGERACETLNALHPHLKFNYDPMIGSNVAVATYDDIDRFKSYHLRNVVGSKTAQRSDVVKRAAYFVKWITKLRPIMFSRLTSTYPKPDLGLLANESFAITYATALISVEFQQDITLTDKIIADLQYDLHYRELSDDALLAIFQIIADVVKERKANPAAKPIVEFGIVSGNSR